MDVRVERADLAAEGAYEGELLRFEHRDGATFLAARRCDLGADDAGADDDDARVRPDHGVERLRVVEGAHDEHVREVGAFAPELARARSGRDEQLPVFQGATVGQDDRLLGGNEARGAHSERELDPMLLVVGRRAEEELVLGELAAEELLREGRAIVGQVRLGPDEDDGAVERLPSEVLGGAPAGEARAHDHDRIRHFERPNHGTDHVVEGGKWQRARGVFPA